MHYTGILLLVLGYGFGWAYLKARTLFMKTGW